MQAGTRITVVALTGAACAGALAALLWMLRAGEGAAPSAKASERATARFPEASVDAAGGSEAAGEARVPLPQPDPDQAAPSAVVGETVALDGPALALEQMKPKLLASMEASLLGVMEPEVFLDAALELTRLEIDPRAIPEPSPNGSIRFKVLGTPPGMTAELSVGRARNPNWDDVITLRMSLDPPQAPYVVDGRSSGTPEAWVTVWRDLEGALEHCTVATSVIPDGRISDSGLPLDSGEVAFGGLYSLDADDPSKNVVKMTGLQDGVTGDLKLPMELRAEPPLWKMTELSSGLVAMYGKAKE